MRVTRVTGLWKNIALWSNVTVLRGNWLQRIENNLYLIIKTPMYGHVSVWLHESYEGYGSLEKYCIVIKCYGVTG